MVFVVFLCSKFVYSHRECASDLLCSSFFYCFLFLKYFFFFKDLAREGLNFSFDAFSRLCILFTNYPAYHSNILFTVDSRQGPKWREGRSRKHWRWHTIDQQLSIDIILWKVHEIMTPEYFFPSKYLLKNLCIMVSHLKCYCRTDVSKYGILNTFCHLHDILIR